MKVFNKVTLAAGAAIALSALFAPANAQAAAATFSVSPANGNYTAGSTLNVNIYVNTGADSIDSARADLTYNPSALQLLDVSNSGSPFGTCVTSATGGSGSLTTGDCTSLGQKKQGSLKLGQASFKVLGNTGTASINFSTSSQAVNGGTDLPESFANGTFTMTAPAVAPNPGTTAPAPKTTAPNNGSNQAAANNTNAPATAADTAQNSTTAAPAAEEVKGENTEKSTDKKSENKDDAEKTSDNIFGRIVLLALIGAAAFFAGRTLARYMAQRNKPSAAAKKTDAAIAAGAAKTKKSTKTNK